MSRHAYQIYQNQSVETALPGELTLMLYNGCLKFIKLAKKAMVNRDIESKNTNFLKAEQIIRELSVTLDQSIIVSNSMMQMYDYIYRRLIEANVNNDAGILTEVEEYIIEFRDAWKEALLTNRKQRYGEGGQA